MSGSTNTLSVGDAFSVSAGRLRNKAKRRYNPTLFFVPYSLGT
ncbi:hypothetical protein [Nitrosomonas mobilis]|nr:hypothetical protein [Nitrosomonas mobilis]